MTLTPIIAHLAPSGQRAYHAVLTPTSLHLLSPAGAPLAVLPCALPPARASAAFMAQRHICASHDGRALALVGDDKRLRVFALHVKEQAIEGLQEGSERLDCPLPKRVSALAWEEAAGEERILLVGDRHGDVRALPVSLSGPLPAPLAQVAADNESPDAAEAREAAQHPAMTPRIGSVSMLLSMLPIASSSAAAPPAHLITTDRDAHIRISHWGAQRAGHLIARFLLRATLPVSALARPLSQPDLLLASEGPRLRLWAWRAGEMRALWEMPHVEKHVCVDAQMERMRENGSLGKWNARGKKRAAREEEGEEVKLREEPKTLVVREMQVVREGDKEWLVWVLDGSTAVHMLPLHVLLSSPSSAAPEDPLHCASASDEPATDVSSHLQTFDFKRPVLSLAVVEHGEQGLQLWASLDMRADVGAGEAGEEEEDVKVLEIKDGGLHASTAGTDLVAALGTRETLDAAALSTLALYPHLTASPKPTGVGAREGGADSAGAARAPRRSANGKRARGREEGRARLALHQTETAGP